MVTQLLFGEIFEIMHESEKWVQIRIDHDGYECWIGDKQFKTLTEGLFAQLQLEQHTYTADIVQVLTEKETKESFPIVLGSTLPQFNKKVCAINETRFNYEGTKVSPEGKPLRETIVENAYMYLRSPYLWGGRSPFGIDCSGFTQMVYKLCGINLKRDAWQQAEIGTALNFIDEAQSGDLAFFDNDEGQIIHVGIILPENKIIHASGEVRIDTLDHYGIYNTEKQKYSHQLRIIKQLI